MQKKLKFYNVKTKQTFETDKVVEKQAARGLMLLAVAASPYTGVKVCRILGRKK
jgi:hypothetical protein